MGYNFYEGTIRVKDILQNERFRISRNFRNPELAASIKSSGMLEKPFLIKTGNYYYPLTCHNRIRLISEIDKDEIDAYVLHSPEYEVFISYFLLKNYRNECGPVGKIKAISILQNEFGIDGSELTDLARKTLKIPHEIFSEEKNLKSIMQLPEALKDYIDIKDIPFRLIKDIISFDEGIIAELSRWVEKVQIRLNIFKMLVDFLFDIRKRDGGFEIIEDEVLLKMDDKALYDYVFRVRYPEYSQKKIEADRLISMLNGKGVSVEFPEFFEKDYISLRFTINRREPGNKIPELVSGIDSKKIDALLELL